MAMQDNITVSSPSFAAESSSLRLVSKKDRKKQQEELLNLASLLKTLEEELKGAKEGATETGASAKTGASEAPGNSSFEKAMAEMAFALQMLQVKITKFGQEKANYDGKIAEAEVTAATKHLKQLEKELQKIHQQEEKSKHASFWTKIADIFVAAVSAVVALITLQPELLIITVVSLASATGVFKDITNGVSKLLELCHVPDKVAKITAAVLVSVCVTVAAAACGDPEQILNSTAEAGVDVAEDVVNGTASTVEEIGETSSEEASQGIMDKLSSVFKKIGEKNPFRKLPKRVNIAAFAGMQAISQTGVISTLVEMGLESNKHISKKKRKEIEMALNIALAVAAAIVTMGAGGAAMGSTGAKVAMDTTSFSSKIMANASNFYVLGALGQGAAGFTEGTFQIQQGKLEEALSTIKAGLTLINEAIDMSSNETADDQKNRSDMIKSEKMGAQTISNLMNGMAGFAELFTEYSPV